MTAIIDHRVFSDFFNQVLGPYQGTPTLKAKTYHQRLSDALREGCDPSGYPLTDAFSDEDGNQVIEVAMAGFAKEDISIQVEDIRLTISYNSPHATAEDEDEYYWQNSRKIAQRSFSRTFADPSNRYDMSRADASYFNGLLRVVIPLKEESRPTNILIK
tara:strand:- start:522 stop:998 length:477 start_codon:yes stop_codon:yes gene_type:complete